MHDSKVGRDIDIDFSPLESLAVNTPDPHGIPPGGPLAGGRDLFVWDLTLLEPGSFSSEAEWETERAGSIWGIGVWMDMELWDGVRYNNAPGEREVSWGQGHFPLTSPLEVGKGALIKAVIDTRTDPAGMVWWNWKVWTETDMSDVREGNSFSALPMSDERRRILQEQGRLPVSRWAEVDAYLLNKLAEMSLADAAADAFGKYPDLLGDIARAKRRASSLRERYLGGEDGERRGELE
jgi:hypothetical protein